MNINEILSLKYKYLQNLCVKNVIKEVENTQGLKDIEDNDLLNTLCIRWLTKYKDIEFNDINEIFLQLKKEFKGEMNYQKKSKPNQLKFNPIIDIQDSDVTED